MASASWQSPENLLRHTRTPLTEASNSCLPTDPSSIRLPSSVLTAPLGLLYSAVVPKGAFSIREQPQPPNAVVSTLGSNWHRAQARWLNTNQHADASGQAPIVSMVLHSDVSLGVHPHRDLFFVTNPFSTNRRLITAFWH